MSRNRAFSMIKFALEHAPVSTEVASTSPMDRLITVRRFLLMASNEAFSAAV